MNRNGRGGFTLLELMIVVGIIGVLAAISVVKFIQLIDKAREAATRANLGALRAAVSIYFADTKGIWPRELTTNTWSNSGEGFPAFIPRYIQRVPRATLQRPNPHPHTPEIEAHVEYVTTEVYGELTQDHINDKAGWVYSSNSGDIRVNCNHRDSTAFNNPNSTIYYSNYGHEI
jgi:prepilin-type N-terminal cleavage/methylation domain-containing protein